MLHSVQWNATLQSQNILNVNQRSQANMREGEVEDIHTVSTSSVATSSATPN